MMKSKTILLTILLASLFILTACQPQQTATPERGAYLGGSQGIVANFELFGVEEEGVYTIFSTETFPLEVTLFNKGEYEVQASDVMIRLLGPSQSEFSGIASWDLPNEGVIDKISELAPDGGEETITFATDALYLTDVAGIVDREWFANVEYNYKTEVIIPEVCLKEDLTDARVCDVKEAKQFFVSGAPITVTSVEEDTAGKGIMALKIKVSNVGGGKVTNQGEEFSATTQKLSFSLDDADWECKSAGKVNEARLREGEAEIVCKLTSPLTEGALSTKQVKLTLDYKYRDIIQETLRIKESSE